MPLRKLDEKLGLQRAAHLLRRTCFGGTRQEIDEFANLTPQQAVDRLFRFNEGGFTASKSPIHPNRHGEDWAEEGVERSANTNPISLLCRYVLCVHIANMTGHEVPADNKLPFIFRERLVYFLHTHFTLNYRVVIKDPRFLYYQMKLFRLLTTENMDIKKLTKKVSLDNAMMRFLDGRLNQKGKPNENYARELLELYSIGRGLEGHVPETGTEGDYYYFTEEDVVAGAKVLTGFNLDKDLETIDTDTGIPTATIHTKDGTTAHRHEDGVKKFSERFGNAEVRPNAEVEGGVEQHTRESMIDEVNQFIDIIFDQEETARHICRKLYRFFVYYKIDQALSDDIIEDMAGILRANDYKILPVLEALLTSEHFYNRGGGKDGANIGTLIKSPLDVVVGFMRALKVDIAPLDNNRENREAYYDLLLDQIFNIDRMGHDFYQPSMVAGYPAHHQFPTYNQNWMNATFMSERYDFIRRSIEADPEKLEAGDVDILSFVEDNFAGEAGNARELIIAIARYFLPLSENSSFEGSGTGELSSERLNYFMKIFLQEPNNTAEAEEMWAENWRNQTNREDMAGQLQDLFNAMLQSPEYQLM